MDKEKIVKLLTEIKDNDYKEVIVYSLKIQDYLIKEEEYESINELISRVVSKMIGKNIILK